jgi:hypothetical protein
MHLRDSFPTRVRRTDHHFSSYLDKAELARITR